MQIGELPKHVFFLGCQYHPEFTSRPLIPNPLFSGFITACKKKKIIPISKELKGMGYKIYATEHTAETLRTAGINEVTVLYKVKEPEKTPNILNYLLEGKIDFVINLPTVDIAKTPKKYQDTLGDEYTIRRLAVEFNVPVVTTLELASALVKVLKQGTRKKIVARSLNGYMNGLKGKYW